MSIHCPLCPGPECPGQPNNNQDGLMRELVAALKLAKTVIVMLDYKQSAEEVLSSIDAALAKAAAA